MQVTRREVKKGEENLEAIEVADRIKGVGFNRWLSLI